MSYSKNQDPFADSMTAQHQSLLQGSCCITVYIGLHSYSRRHCPMAIAAVSYTHLKMNKAKLPTHVELDTRRCDMVKDSVILLEQLRTIDKQRLKERICHIDDELQKRVDLALMVSLELPAPT